MKQFLFWLIVLVVLVVSGAGGYQYYNATRSAAGQFRMKAVRRGDVKLVVRSTGTVQPVLSVQIGAFVSGPIQSVFVNFNDKVKKGQILAQIDPTLFQATVDQNKAAIKIVEANLALQKANLALAEANLRRDEKLLKIHGALPESQYDTDLAARDVAKANVGVQEAGIKQAEATLRQATINLAYCDIKSPSDGVVTDRKVDPGQTLAAQFTTPVMFVVAPDLDKHVYVWANVDEADIGLICAAQEKKQPVTFTVNAYPNDSFSGEIFQVRLNPTTVSNVVTYTVIVDAPNVIEAPGGNLKLKPGMTANLEFQIEQRKNVLTVPNSALIFHPKPEQVRKSDVALVVGQAADADDDSVTDSAEKNETAAGQPGAPGRRAKAGLRLGAGGQSVGRG